jgi:hypothetical protein
VVGIGVVPKLRTYNDIGEWGELRDLDEVSLGDLSPLSQK